MRCPVRWLLLASLAVLCADRRGLGQPPDPTVELSKLFFDAPPAPLDEARIAGLPAGTGLGTLTWPNAYRLALIRAREANPPRFDSLDSAGIGEAARRLGVDDFGRFRTDFTSARTFRDPSADVLGLQARLLSIENARRELAHLERWLKLITELVNGEASGLGQTDVDQLHASVAEARSRLSRRVADYRDQLDVVKVSLGLAPRTPLTVDLGPLRTFRANFEAIDRWSLNPRRELEELSRLAVQLPSPGEVTIDGRPILAEIERDADRLEEVLSLATRVALGNRREGDDPGEAVELRVRRRVRHLAEIRSESQRERQASVLAVRLMDDDFEQIIAPNTPPGTSGRPAQAVQKLVESNRKIMECRDRLVALWAESRSERLALDRDLGLFPFEDWTSFFGQFVAEPTTPAGANPVEPVRPIPPPAPPALPPPPAPPAKPPGGR